MVETIKMEFGDYPYRGSCPRCGRSNYSNYTVCQNCNNQVGSIAILYPEIDIREDGDVK